MNHINNRRAYTTLAFASTLTLLGACSSSNDNDEDTGLSPIAQAPTPAFCETGIPPDTQTPDAAASGDGATSYSYVFTRGPMRESAQIERISLTDGNVVDGTYPATDSDHRLATDGTSIFQIGRFDIDNLTKFDAIDTSAAQYQLSLLTDEPSTTNPQSLVFVNNDFAYLTRRSSDSLLVLDPSPEPLTTEALIMGEISLAAYNRPGDEGAVDFGDMTDAILVGDKLFVLLENLDGFAPVETGYLAVIDVCTNMEIETGQGVGELQGIQLDVANPVSLHYNEATGLLYVAGRGNSFGNEAVTTDAYSGGVQSIDPDTFETALLIDDGTEADNNGFYTNLVVIDDTLGYAITFDGFDEDFNLISNLRSLNLETGEVSEPIDGTAGQILTTIALGPDNHLWVGIQDDNPGFIRVNLEDGVPAQERVRTTLIPDDVLFLEVDR